MNDDEIDFIAGFARGVREGNKGIALIDALFCVPKSKEKEEKEQCPSLKK